MRAVLILDGGKASRMGGRDKALLPLGSQSFMDRLMAILAPQSSKLAISANEGHERFTQWPVPVLADGFQDLGPLAGLLSGLEWAAKEGCSDLLTVPGDTPFVPSDLYDRLDPAPAVAVFGERRHHLVATWPAACRDALRALLEDAQHNSEASTSVRRFADMIGVREVSFGETGADPFFNVNTPDEYEAALALFTGAGLTRTGQ